LVKGVGPEFKSQYWKKKKNKLVPEVTEWLSGKVKGLGL
jgi:hypothetical protein